MSLAPKIVRPSAVLDTRHCPCCATDKPKEYFIKVRPSTFLLDGSTLFPLCADCIDKIIEREGDNCWSFINRMCCYLDIPFYADEWMKFYKQNKRHAFLRYAQAFGGTNSNRKFSDNSIDWDKYNRESQRLEREGLLKEKLPVFSEAKHQEQLKRWGHGYDNEALGYLDQLYNGIMTTQSINGTLQVDQAVKLCKISYVIDQRIEEGTDFDKMLTSYDKLVKIAEFTPRNVKNLNNLESVGELVKYMEKRGWKNKFYDSAKQDIVDETIQNIQNFNQRLYVNESSIGDQITRRIENLKAASALEAKTHNTITPDLDLDSENSNYYGTDKEFEDNDMFDNESYEKLFEDEDEDND